MEEAASFPLVNQGRKTWSDARAALGNATWEPGVLFHSSPLALSPGGDDARSQRGTQAPKVIRATPLSRPLQGCLTLPAQPAHHLTKASASVRTPLSCGSWSSVQTRENTPQEVNKKNKWKSSVLLRCRLWET